MPKPFQITLSPEILYPPLNPMSFFHGPAFGAVDVDVGFTQRRDIEMQILEKVGSYGRQIGRIGEAVEVLTRYLPREILDEESRKAIDALREQVAEIQKIKERPGTGASPLDA